MTIRLAEGPDDQRQALAWLESQPQGSLWQSAAWKVFQEALGRQVRVYVADEAGSIKAAALVVIDRTALGLSVWEIPRGPLSNEATSEKALLEKIAADARNERAMRLLCSSPTPRGFPAGFRPSRRHVHPDATRILDLTLDDEALLAQMKQKGRYNIKVAERHGVKIEQSTNAVAFAKLASDTGKRDGFTPHQAALYEKFLQNVPGSFLLLATTATLTDPIAGLIGVIHGTTGIYYYGASSHDPAARPLMAPYLLQWHAMQLCRNKGCTRYDLFGIAPEGFANHPWSGVTDFKEKFGGQYVVYPPEQEMVLRPVAKMMLEMKRKILG